jgi:hypothetical protein
LDAAVALEDAVGAAAGADAGDDVGGGADSLGPSPSPAGALARRPDELADAPPLAVGAAWAETVPAGPWCSSLDPAAWRSAGNRREADTDTVPADVVLGDDRLDPEVGTGPPRSEPVVGEEVSIPGNIGPSPVRARPTPPVAPESTPATPGSAAAR